MTGQHRNTMFLFSDAGDAAANVVIASYRYAPGDDRRAFMRAVAKELQYLAREEIECGDAAEDES